MRCDACGEVIGVVTWTNSCKLYQACAAAAKSRYYYLSRPPAIGCQPAGFTDREAWMPVQDIPGTEWPAFGWVEYAKPLDFIQVWKYDLRPADADELARYQEWREEEGM